MSFEDAVAVVTGRFDRTLVNGELARVHAEDFWQAFTVHPERK